MENIACKTAIFTINSAAAKNHSIFSMENISLKTHPIETGDGRSAKRGLCHFKILLLNICY